MTNNSDKVLNKMGLSMDNNSLSNNNHNTKMKVLVDEEQNMKEDYNNYSMEFVKDTMNDYPMHLASTIHDYNDRNSDMVDPLFNKNILGNEMKIINDGRSFEIFSIQKVVTQSNISSEIIH